MKRVGFLYDDLFLNHVPPDWHPESPVRLRAVITALKGSGEWERLVHLTPSRAGFSDIGAVHDHGYIERVKNAGTGYLDPDTYMSEGSLDAALHAAGAVMDAVRECGKGTIERAFCAVRPPGHHAEADRAMGFCIFNNIAVGARYAQKRGFEKVFIIDFDVHHGNGTEHIFYEDDSVFYFSTHQYPHYPGTGGEAERGSGRGEGFTRNVPLPAGSGDAEYLRIYSGLLRELLSSFDPAIVLVSAGYDIHARDPLAGMNVTDRGVEGIVRGILDAAGDVPVVFSLEGGYDLTALSNAVLITLREMLRE